MATRLITTPITTTQTEAIAPSRAPIFSAFAEPTVPPVPSPRPRPILECCKRKILINESAKAYKITALRMHAIAVIAELPPMASATGIAMAVVAACGNIAAVDECDRPTNLAAPRMIKRQITLEIISDNKISSQYFLRTLFSLNNGMAKAIVTGLINQKIISPPGL